MDETGLFYRVQQELVRKVIRFLQTRGKLAKSLEIAKAVDLSRVVEINPTLYHLEQRGIIEKCIASPPTWALIQSCPAEEDLFGAQNDEASAGSSQSHVQRGYQDEMIPVFQQTSLFPSDTQQTSVKMGNSRVVMEESMDDDDDIGSSVTAGHGVMPGIVKREENDPYASIANSIVDVERAALAKREKLMEDTAYQERDIGNSVCKVGDFRDSLGINYPISSDDESSEGSPSDMDTKTPEESIETSRMTFGDLSSTDIANMTYDVSDVPGEDYLPQSDFTAEFGNGNMDGTNVNMSDERDSDLKCLVESANADPDTSSEEMEDCKKVLKVLATLPGTTQFVLSKKSQLPPDKLAEALKKCESLNYISGSSKLWKITPSGENYAKDQFSDEEWNNSSIGPQVVLPPKPKKTYSGPPPPPRAILKDKGMLNNVDQCQVPSRTVVSNSQRTFPGSCLSNSQAKPTPVDSSPAGPRPLMSLKFDSVPLLAATEAANSDSNSLYSSSASMKHSSLSGDSSTKSVSTLPTFPAQHLQAACSVNSKQSSVLSSHRSDPSTSCAEASRQSHQGFPFPPLTSEHTCSTGKGLGLNSGLWDFQNSDIGMSDTKANRAVSVNSRLTDQAPKVIQSKPAQFKSFQVSKPPPEPVRREIPKEYADYPNQSTSLQCLKSKVDRKGIAGSLDPSQSAFNKGPPPSPLDILSKGLKRTEISSVSSQPSNTVYQPSTSISAKTQTATARIPLPPSQSLGAKLPTNPVVDSQHSLMNKASGTLSSGNKPTVQTPATFGSAPLALSNESFAALNKNPVSALMEYAQSRKMVAKVEVLSRKGAAHKPMFVMAAFMGDRQFPTITCSNKKIGRKEACDIALRQLVAEGQFKQGDGSEDTAMPAVPSDNMTHFDKIAALTHRGFTALVSQITTESFAGRKVIAGLVMKRSESDTGVLISLGTGNRCITGQQLSLQGNTVNDSHAEIITRRGFLRFLYKQLLEYHPDKPHPMFEASPNGKLQIRDNISFHLYISTAPCGDGALFSPRDVEAQKLPVDTQYKPKHNPTFNSNVQGLLRTKVEGGEGTIPVEAGFKGLTFDGVQRGERLLTMSCTDKICRWNVVGMQGALLSHFLEPVYLDSLTLGLLFDPGHLSRAVCCRVELGPTDIHELLPEGYRLNHPWLGRVTVCDPPREIQKTKALSINWAFGDSGPEVTDGTQGLCYTSIEKEFFSRCSKRKLFNSFKLLCEKFERNDLLAAANYKEAKTMAKDFQAAREALLAKMKENKFGKWVSKPVEEEMFDWNEHK